MATQAERRHSTRTQLLASARKLFVEQGIGATTTQQILDASALSRGALYHHFASRDDLVAAVYDAESAAAIERALARSRASDSPTEALLGSCLAWLDEVGEPAVARLLVVDGPSALGWSRCREIEERHSLDRMRGALQAAARAGEIELVSADLVARLLNAVLTESALAIAHAEHPEQTRTDAEAAIRQLVAGLHTAA